jgi:hypothetical protein
MVLFTGAGASAHLGFPICRQFFGHPKTRPLLNSEPLEDIVKFLDVHGRPEETDIEAVLWVTALLTGLEPGTMNPLPLAPYLRAQLERAKKAGGPDHDDLRRLDTALKEAVIDIFGRLPSEPELRYLSRFLLGLNGLTNSKRLSIFTTNYDRALDSEVAKIGQADRFAYCSDGFYGRELVPTWSPSNYNTALSGHEQGATPEIYTLYKLHGSVDWAWQDDGTTRKVARDTGARKADLAQHVVIFPAFKGVPNIDALIYAHWALKRELSEAGICVVVGFSFRDDFINSIFASSMQDNQRLFLILVESGSSTAEALFLKLKKLGLDGARLHTVVRSFGEGTHQELLDSISSIANQYRSLV